MEEYELEEWRTTAKGIGLLFVIIMILGFFITIFGLGTLLFIPVGFLIFGFYPELKREIGKIKWRK